MLYLAQYINLTQGLTLKLHIQERQHKYLCSPNLTQLVQVHVGELVGHAQVANPHILSQDIKFSHQIANKERIKFLLFLKKI